MWEKLGWYDDDTYYQDEMPDPFVITVQSLWKIIDLQKYFQFGFSRNISSHPHIIFLVSKCFFKLYGAMEFLC